MTHKQWFNNVLQLHPAHEEGALVLLVFSCWRAFDVNDSSTILNLKSVSERFTT